MRRSLPLGLFLALWAVGDGVAQSYVRLRPGTLACHDRTDWRKLNQLLEQENPRAVRRFLSTRPLDQDCRRIFGSRPAYVQIRSDAAICVRPFGEFECLWTSIENIDQP